MAKRMALLAAGFLGLAGMAAADTISVNAADDIYYAGQASTGGNGNVPTAIISLTSENDFVTFGVTGTVSINGGGNTNDADGVGAAPSSSSETGANGISGMVAPHGGYLVGVFLDGTTPSGSAPSNLDFTSGGLTTSFSTLSPGLDQAFFIGDGLTGDGSGSTQAFYVPTGATELVLGISDACSYNGSPGCYGDNSGTFSVMSSLDTASAAPEPASALLLVGGLGLLGLARRKPARR